MIRGMYPTAPRRRKPGRIKPKGDPEVWTVPNPTLLNGKAIHTVRHNDKNQTWLFIISDIGAALGTRDEYGRTPTFNSVPNTVFSPDGEVLLKMMVNIQRGELQSRRTTDAISLDGLDYWWSRQKTDIHNFVVGNWLTDLLNWTQADLILNPAQFEGEDENGISRDLELLFMQFEDVIEEVGLQVQGFSKNAQTRSRGWYVNGKGESKLGITWGNDGSVEMWRDALIELRDRRAADRG
jgi:hypothetical protein